jgi:hypothetical protein
MRPNRNTCGTHARENFVFGHSEETGEKIAFFFSLFFTAIMMSAAFAHLLELPNKIHPSREDYLTVQQIYRGRALLGIVILCGPISTLVMSVSARKQRAVFIPSLIAFLSIVGSQILFWTYTYPANQVTNNWTFLPANWEHLRRRWEYSHAAGTALCPVAMVALIISALSSNNPMDQPP